MKPSERRSSARTSLVWEALLPVLDGSGDVLDIGGGTGGFAVRVAELGHRVTVVDPSPDALFALARRAAEEGVADRVHGVQGDTQGLLEVAEPGVRVHVLRREDVVEEEEREREGEQDVDGREEHEAEVARGCEASVRGGEMAREGRSPPEEMEECES